MTGVFRITSAGRNAFCVPVIIEACFSIFKLHFCTQGKCKIYQVVNTIWTTLLWDLNIGIKLNLVRLVLNQQRRKIVKCYSKRPLWSGIPKKDEGTFLVPQSNLSQFHLKCYWRTTSNDLCCLTIETKIWFRKLNFK